MDKELEKDEIKILKSQVAKLTLEGKLRKDLGNELERQRKLALDAKNELHLLTDKLSKYLFSDSSVPGRCPSNISKRTMPALYTSE